MSNTIQVFVSEEFDAYLTETDGKLFVSIENLKGITPSIVSKLTRVFDDSLQSMYKLGVTELYATPCRFSTFFGFRDGVYRVELNGA